MKLPKELRQALLSDPFPVIVAVDTESGPGVLLKVYEKDARSISKKRIAILFRPMLYLHPKSAVFRLYIEFRDKAEDKFVVDTFLNPASENDIDILHRLCLTVNVRFLIFDMKLNPIGFKGLSLSSEFKLNLVNMIQRAMDHNDRLHRPNYAEALAYAKENDQ